MRKERLTICHVVAQKNLSSLLTMHWKWQPFLTLASADYNYPCNLTAGVEVLWRFGLLDALEGWRVLTNNRTSEKFYGSPCDKIPSLSPWADGRARRGQCWSPLQLPFSFCYLMSCHSPINLAACVFFCCLLSERPFPLHAVKGSLLVLLGISSPGICSWDWAAGRRWGKQAGKRERLASQPCRQSAFWEREKGLSAPCLDHKGQKSSWV